MEAPPKATVWEEVQPSRSVFASTVAARVRRVRVVFILRELCR
jgi:hypothetical protein